MLGKVSSGIVAIVLKYPLRSVCFEVCVPLYSYCRVVRGLN